MRITSNGESKKRAVRLNYNSDRSVRASAESEGINTHHS